MTDPILEAREPQEVLSALSRESAKILKLEWSENLHATPDILEAWLPECSQETIKEVIERLQVLYDEAHALCTSHSNCEDQLSSPFDRIRTLSMNLVLRTMIPLQMTRDDLGRASLPGSATELLVLAQPFADKDANLQFMEEMGGIVHPIVDGNFVRFHVGEIHELYCLLNQEIVNDVASEILKHPFIPFIKEWQSCPTLIKAHEHVNGITPKGLFNNSLRTYFSTKEPDPDNPEIPGPVSRQKQQLWLPGLEQESLPVSPLVLTDAVGMRELQRGRGARLDKRLLIYSLLEMPLDQRKPHGEYEFRILLGDIINRWLWPTSQDDQRSNWRPNKHGKSLYAAFNAMSVAGVLLTDGSEWRPAVVRQMPNMGDFNSKLIVDLKLPDGCDHGALVHKPKLIAEGMISDPAFDLWLFLAYLWGRCEEVQQRHTNL